MAWSYSSLNTFQNCPYRYFRQYEARDVKDVYESKEASWGIEAHRRFEQRLRNGRPLPPELENYETLCAELEQLPEVHAEYKMALNKKLEPVDWFAADVWSRAAADVLAVNRDTSQLTIVDWKTGKPRYDELQGLVLAFHAHAYFPDVKTIRTRFVFIKYGVEKGDTYDVEKDLDYIWRELSNKIRDIGWAKQSNAWPKRPTGLCGWCPVKDCEHWRERA